MLHDATIEVTCDGAHCGARLIINPEYTYRSMSASSGHYDTSDESINAQVEKEGWRVLDGKHFCEGCES